MSAYWRNILYSDEQPVWATHSETPRQSFSTKFQSPLSRRTRLVKGQMTCRCKASRQGYGNSAVSPALKGGDGRGAENWPLRVIRHTPYDALIAGYGPEMANETG